MSQEVSGPRRAVWDQADMQVRVSAYDGDCNVGDDERKSVTRVLVRRRLLGSFWI